MAEIMKFKASAVKNVFTHTQRKQNDGHDHKNENIDLSRTPLNYSIKRGKYQDWKDRLKDVFHLKQNDLVSFVEVVVTLPKDVAPKDERAFFTACYDFFKQDFKDENIIYATVHKDEITPHMHLGFIPVKEGEFTYNTKRGKGAVEEWKASHNGTEPTERICFKELCPRTYYNNMHKRLQEFCDREMGYHVSILNGATVNGNKTVLELKVKSLTERKEMLQKDISNLEKDKDTVKLTLNKMGIQPKNFELLPLLNEIRNLKEQNEAMKKIIMQNGIKIRSNDIPIPKPLPIKSSSVNVFSGEIDETDIPHSSVVVVEVPKHKSVTESPQSKIISSDEQLRMIAEQMSMETLTLNQKVRLHYSEEDDIYYVVCQQADNSQEIVNLLILIEQMTKEIEDIKDRELYLQRMSADEYDLARTIFSKAECTVNYFEGKEVIERYEQEYELQNESEMGEDE